MQLPDYGNQSANRTASHCVTTTMSRRKDLEGSDFLQQLNELKKASEVQERFQFAQNINKENVIDEKQFDFRKGKIRFVTNKTVLDNKNKMS